MANNDLSRLALAQAALPNKPTSTASLNKSLALESRQLMKRRNFNPIEELIQLCNTSADDELRFKCMKLLLNYYSPALKSVDVAPDSQNNNGAVSVQIIHYDSNTKTETKPLNVSYSKIEESEVEITDYD